ncbi:MAG TPA: hypothetical protein VG537_09050 [Candidatus Kapabacteria bacterium]|jgi:hypothetical protein|nr:hypothetical protein [Candidatus Kapabacteria bacterium]
MAYFTIDEVQIASPCSAEWSSMAGSDTARFCGECKKHVYNLSLLTRAEANELIREKEGRLCVSIYRRIDGTVLTADCPKGLRTIKRQYLKTRVKVAALLAALAGVLSLSANSCATEVYTGIPGIQDSSQCRMDTTVHIK